MAAGEGAQARLPAGADAVAVLRGRPPTGRGRPAPSPSRCPDGPTHALRRRSWRASTASTCTPRSTSAPTPTTAWASTPRSSWRPTARWSARTRKLHIPVTAGYYEDKYFRPGPPATTRFPVVELGDARFGFPTCWDQWFPELARAYSLAGAEVIVYPTAIGSEPDHPDFDTEPLWEQVIVANGIANGTFMVAVNRIGTEAPLTLLRLVVHLRPVRPRARAGAARRARGAGRRPRPRPAPRLARAVPVPDHPPPRHLRLAGRALTAQTVGWCRRAAAGMSSPRCASASSASTAATSNCVPAHAWASASAASSVIGAL